MRALLTITKEKVGMTSGAKARREDVFLADSSGEELGAIGFGQIEMNVFGRRLVTGRHHVEPLEWIGFFACARLIEILVGVGKLRGELGDEVRADFVAARADAGSNSGEKISWI